MHRKSAIFLGINLIKLYYNNFPSLIFSFIEGFREKENMIKKRKVPFSLA
jgi:hypothetical protein